VRTVAIREVDVAADVWGSNEGKKGGREGRRGADPWFFRTEGGRWGTVEQFFIIWLNSACLR